MLPALLLVLAAAPEKRVLVRFHLDSAKGQERETQSAVLYVLEEHKPPHRALGLGPEAKGRLDELTKRVDEDCKQKLDDMTVVACQYHTREALEARAFAALFDEVLDVGASQLVEKPNIILELALWDPKTGKGRRLNSTVALDVLPGAAMEGVKDLLANEGKPYLRPVKTPDELQKAWKSPLKKELARRGLPAVRHSSGCPLPLPAKLTFTPDDALARTVADRWETSVRGHALDTKPEGCTLAYLPLFDQQPFVHVMMDCGPVRASETFRESTPVKDVLSTLSERLVESQLEQRCMGAFGDTPYADAQARELLAMLRGNEATAAIDDLTRMGARAVPYLIVELGSSDALTRRRVAETLGWIGAAARDAVPALEKASKDSDPGVAAAVQKALQQIRG